MPHTRAPWWMYIVAASLLGNFALSIYLYFWGPEPPFSRFNFKREALGWKRYFQTRQEIGQEYKLETECCQ